MSIEYFFYLIFCLILIAFFSGIEIAFVSVNRFSIDVRKNQGSWGAKYISKYFIKPEKFITSSLVGLNLALIFFGILFQKFIEPIWTTFPPFLLQYPIIFFIIELFFSTMIIFIIGEFLPKLIFKNKNLYLLIFFAPFIRIVYLVLQPITSFFVFLSDFILHKIFKISSLIPNKRTFKYVDLEHFIAEKTLYEKVQNSIQNKLLENVIQFSKTQVRECLIPRNEIKAVNVQDSIEEVKKKFIELNLSRMIVYKNNLDNIVGYIHHIDLFNKPRSIKSILIPIPIFSETTKINMILQQFTQHQKSLGWIIDEYGITAGIITMEKLLEEVFGQDGVQDEYFINSKIVQKKITDNIFDFSGRIELDYLKEFFLIVLPKEGIETLSGFLIQYNGSIPKLNDVIIFNQYEFLITEMSERKIEKVRLTIKPSVS